MNPLKMEVFENLAQTKQVKIKIFRVGTSNRFHEFVPIDCRTSNKCYLKIKR